MKQEVYLIKAKRLKIIRTAISVLLCVVFIPLIAFNGVLIAKGEFNQRKVHSIVDTSAGIVQTKASVSTATRYSDETLTITDESKTDIEEETSKEEPATITVAEETQGTVYSYSSTQSQTEPITTAAKPAATKPAATQPAVKKPATTQPVATQPATTQPATTKPAIKSNTPCVHLDNDEQVMLNLINQERAKNGLPEVKLDTNLRNVAQTKSKEMIELNYFSHQSPVYGSPFDMMKYFGINYSKAGENLSMNTSVERAHLALMNSEEHRKTILNPDYTRVGIGAYQGVSGKYYSQMFICS